MNESPSFEPSRHLGARTSEAWTPAPSSRKEIFLHPGQIFSTAEGCVVTTILGTCVSVCLFDPFRGAGGLNHFMLPDPLRGPQASPRYGPMALARLLDAVLELGCTVRHLQAKVFGGMRSSAFKSGKDLGQRNVELALEFLDTHHIRVVASDTGGERGRKVIFDLADGSAWVKRL